MSAVVNNADLDVVLNAAELYVVHLRDRAQRSTTASADSIEETAAMIEAAIEAIGKDR